MADPVDRLLGAIGDADDLRFFRAPGRVNLMGDHTDYSEWALITHDGDADRVPRADKLRSGAENDLEFLPDDLLRDLIGSTLISERQEVLPECVKERFPGLALRRSCRDHRWELRDSRLRPPALNGLVHGGQRESLGHDSKRTHHRPITDRPHDRQRTRRSVLS